MAETGPETQIALAGQVCIDRNDVEGRLYTSWGSPVLYMADYYQRAHGITPAVLAPHGPDFTEYASGFSLHPEGPTAEQTLVYENTLIDGVRTQQCKNADRELLLPVDEEIKRLVSNADIMFLAPLTPAYHPDYVEELLAPAHDGRLSVLLPQGYLREIGADSSVNVREFEESSEIIPNFNLLILSEEDVEGAVGLAQEWRKKHPGTNIVVTKGPDGASIVETGEEIPVPTTPVNLDQALDTIGCGDTFSATVAYYFMKDPSDLLGAVHRANLAARLKLLSGLSGYPAV